MLRGTAAPNNGSDVSKWPAAIRRNLTCAMRNSIKQLSPASFPAVTVRERSSRSTLGGSVSCAVCRITPGERWIIEPGRRLTEVPSLACQVAGNLTRMPYPWIGKSVRDSAESRPLRSPMPHNPWYSNAHRHPEGSPSSELLSRRQRVGKHRDILRCTRVLFAPDAGWYSR